MIKSLADLCMNIAKVTERLEESKCILKKKGVSSTCLMQSRSPLVKKLLPFFSFIRERILNSGRAKLDRNSHFLYCVLPIWSYIKKGFPSGYPMWFRDGAARRSYQYLCEIFSGKDDKSLDFSFVSFLSHQIRSIPNVFEVKFHYSSGAISFAKQRIANSLSSVVCDLYVDSRIVLYFKQHGWNVKVLDLRQNYASLGSCGKAVMSAYESFAQKINDCKPFLQVIEGEKREELLFGLFKFLYAYIAVFGHQKINTITIFPAKVYKTSRGYDLGYGCFIIASDSVNPWGNSRSTAEYYSSISLTMNLAYSSLAISDWADFRNHKDALTSTKAAIGSIMSRNGSHNIGSHVLSALSHNVATMPDDRILYQYIQHRMDYIATATTEFPRWTVPTMLVGELMKNFYSQKHLLNYISQSEGLSAYKFQGRNFDDITRLNQYSTIRILLRRFHDLTQGGPPSPPRDSLLVYSPTGDQFAIHYFFGEKGRFYREISQQGDKRCRYETSTAGEFKFLETDKTCITDWSQDVEMAVPGGVVGHHAFYTIIENVIRNAAKHSWVQGRCESEKDLEIYIDFGERNKDGTVVVTIGDNVSRIFGNDSEEGFWRAFFEKYNCIGVWQKLFDVDNWCNILDVWRKKGDAGSQIYAMLHKALKNVIDKDSFDTLSDFKKTQLRKEIKGLLLRCFSLPLGADDANKVKGYLRREDRNEDVFDVNLWDENSLPFIYWLQRKFLMERTSDEVRGWESFLTSNCPDNPSQKGRIGRRLVLPLHHDLHRKLARAFINDDGRLRKENWGLAEMKISAGYLCGCSIKKIGGINGEGANILVPVAMPATCRNPNSKNCLACSEQEGLRCQDLGNNCPKVYRFHLGYQFVIARPKEFLLVFNNGKEITRFKKDSSVDNWGRCGIDFGVLTRHGEKEVLNIGGKEGADPNYNYLVFVEFVEKAEPKCSRMNSGGFRQLHLTLTSNDVGNIRMIGDRGEHVKVSVDNIKSPEGIINAIHTAWIRSLMHSNDQCHDRSYIKLSLNTTGNEDGMGRGLVSTKDLIRMLFEECFHPALIDFYNNPPSNIELSDTTKHLIMLLSLIHELPDGIGADEGIDRQLIRRCLEWYCNLVKNQLDLSDEFKCVLKLLSSEMKTDMEKENNRRSVLHKIAEVRSPFESGLAMRLMEAQFDENTTVRDGCCELVDFLLGVAKYKLDKLLDVLHGGGDEYFESEECSRKVGMIPKSSSFTDNLKAVLTVCSQPEECEFEALVDSLYAMFLASDVYLRKYEERISTLPTAYKMAERHDGYERPHFDLQAVVDDVLQQKAGANSGNTLIVKYSRHDRARSDNFIYTEALSGSQSYLNMLAQIGRGVDTEDIQTAGADPSKANRRVKAQVTNLLENAFLRILIVDERVADFLTEHKQEHMCETYINMGIWVARVKDLTSVDSFSPSPSRHSFKDELFKLQYAAITNLNGKDVPDILNVKKDDFDILIIHQGLIDKWWVSHDKTTVGKVLNKIRERIPYVAVTTGRGRPDNIPDNEYVLPFSCIEAALFRRYPEKLTLVNTLLSLIPGNDQSEE